MVVISLKKYNILLGEQKHALKNVLDFQKEKRNQRKGKCYFRN